MTLSPINGPIAHRQSCRVVCGANESQFEILVGKTVKSVQRSLREVFNISVDAVALVNGTVVDPDHLLCAGDTLEFFKPLGEKGLGNLLTAQDLIERWRISAEKYRELLKRGLPTFCFEDGSMVHPEFAVDDWIRRLSLPECSDSPLAAALGRIADHFDPPPPDKIGSEYVAQKLGCTTTWIADLVRRGEIPKSCIVIGTGNGKPWKFHRNLIDKWIETR